MAKHVWAIVNLDDGSVQGTNDSDQIEKIINDDSFICIHADAGVYFHGNRQEQEIETLEEEEEAEESEEDSEDEDDGIPF